MTLQLAVIAAATVAGVLAWRVRIRPLAALLWFGAASDVLREALGAWVLRPERARLLALVGGDTWARAPFEGWTRAAFHAEQALYLAWPAAVAAFAIWACAPRSEKSEQVLDMLSGQH